MNENSFNVECMNRVFVSLDRWRDALWDGCF